MDLKGQNVCQKHFFPGNYSNFLGAKIWILIRISHETRNLDWIRIKLVVKRNNN
jgi:hypothetical protein